MIDCSKITEDTKDMMFSLIEKSEKEKREYHIELCEDKNGDIVHSNFCAGTSYKTPKTELKKGQITIGRVSAKKITKLCQCPANTKEIGDFHTHPFHVEPSEPDIVSTASSNEQSLCIGARDREWIEEMKSHKLVDKIVCYDIIDKELLRLGKDAQELDQKGEIDKAKKKIIPLMFDRISRVRQSPFSTIPGILNIKCKMTKIK